MKINFLLILLFLSACNNKSHQNLAKFRDLSIDYALGNLQEPEAKEEDLFHHHQQSIVKWIDGENVVKSYTYSQRKLGAFSYVPLLSFFLPRNYQNYEIIITMKNGSIAQIQSFQGMITLESESNCNEAIFSCVTNIK